MPRVAILSDTHVPSRAEAIPEWVREELGRADHVVHAGDFDSAEAYETIRDLSTELTAARGNMDPTGLAGEVATVSVGGVEFVVTHGTGPSGGYRDRVASTAREVAQDAVAIAGHTHEPTDELVDGVRLLNPGSATGAAPASRATMIAAEAEDGDLDATLLVEGDPADFDSVD